MKRKIIGLATGALILAGAVLASDRWVIPQTMNFSSTANTNLVASTTWTNVGDRMILQSVWISGATLTNGTLKLANISGVTNDLPLSIINNTLYYIANENHTLEGGAVLILTGVNSSTNPAVGKMIVYMIRPE